MFLCYVILWFMIILSSSIISIPSNMFCKQFIEFNSHFTIFPGWVIKVTKKFGSLKLHKINAHDYEYNPRIWKY